MYVCQIIIANNGVYFTTLQHQTAFPSDCKITNFIMRCNFCYSRGTSLLIDDNNYSKLPTIELVESVFFRLAVCEKSEFLFLKKCRPSTSSSPFDILCAERLSCSKKILPTCSFPPTRHPAPPYKYSWLHSFTMAIRVKLGQEFSTKSFQNLFNSISPRTDLKCWQYLTW